MAKKYFTICLNVEDQSCLLVGGTEEALEKSVRFLEAGARLTVVSPRLIPELRALLKRYKAAFIKRKFRASDVRGRFFVINSVKTDQALSRSIYEACLKERCLISGYDQPQWSNVTMPFLVRSGPLRVAISTNAGSPGLAATMGRELERNFEGELASFAEWVVAARARMVAQGAGPDERRAYFRALLKDFKMKAMFTYPPEYLKQKKGGRKP